MLRFFEQRYWLVASALIGVMAVVMIVSTLGETQTWDEGMHIVAGYSYVVTGDYRLNPEHPALAKILCALPLRFFFHPRFDQEADDWKKERTIQLGLTFVWRNNMSPDMLLFAARCSTIVLTLLLAVWLAFWTRRRFGAAVGLFALTLLTFDPNIIAHGRYITTDAAACLFIFLTCTLWIEYLLERRWYWLILTGVSLGLAFSSKYSALFVAPVLIAMLLIRQRRQGPLKQRMAELATCTLTLAALCIAGIALVYWPEVARARTMRPLAPRLTRIGQLGKPLGFIADKLHSPEFTFLIGLDRLSEHDALGHNAYLLGNVSDKGWWYYFPVAFAVKTPAAVLAGIILAIFFVWRARSRLRDDWFLLTMLAIPPAVFWFFCIKSHIDIGLRHLLPTYPFLYVLLAVIILKAGPELKRAYVWVACAIPLLVVIESAAIFPHYLSFFNIASGGPSNGPKYLLDSNIDWGQDGIKLGNYMGQHGIPYVALSYFGNVDLTRYGVRYINVPEAEDAEGIRKMDCYAAISATPLFGQYVGKKRYEFLRVQKPVARIGNSIYLYDLRKNKN